MVLQKFQMPERDRLRVKRECIRALKGTVVVYCLKLKGTVLAREGKSKGRQMSDAEATIGGKKSSSCTDQSDRGNDFAVLSRTILNTL